jgi:transposase
MDRRAPAMGRAADLHPSRRWPGCSRPRLEGREAELAAIEAQLGSWATAEPLAGTVGRLGAYRGIAQLTGLTLAAEVMDWYRFASARAFMGFACLVFGRQRYRG